jgi:hypothetical protein
MNIKTVLMLTAVAALTGAAARSLTAVRAGCLPEGSSFRVYLALYGALRLLLDPFRGDGRLERFMGLSHQQGLAVACLVVAVLLKPARFRPATAQ